MMKNKKLGFLAIGWLAFMSLTNEAQALPMFGKQTGLDCTACHMQHMPKLNSVGRKFAASGMTQSIKSADANSSGVDINPSIMFKTMYEQTWDLPTSSGTIKDTPTDGGDWSVPKTATLFLGGRVTENLGAIVNASYKDAEDNSLGGKIVYAKETKDGYLGAALYSSANFGPFSGMENYNSSLYKPLKTFDMKKLANAFQATGVGSGSATGIQLYFDSDKLISNSDHIFASVGVYAPAQDNLNMNIASNFLPLARLAYEYRIGDFNFILGGFAINGGETVSSSESLHIKQKTYGMDFQIEGTVAEKEVSLIVSNVLKNQITYTGRGSNLLDPEQFTNVDNKAFSIEGEVNLTPQFGVKLAYMAMNDLYGYPNSVFKPNDPNSDYSDKHINVRDIDSATTVGFDYSFQVYLPMKLAVEYAWAKPYLDRVSGYEDFMLTLNILY
jgi:hypothetical protein